MSLTRLGILFFLIMASFNCMAQSDSAIQNVQVPEQYVDQVTSKISKVDEKLSKQTLKALKQFNKLETRLKRKLHHKDSSDVGNQFEYSTKKIQELTTEFSSMPDKAITKLTGEYNAYLDTLRTSFKFLEEQGTKVISQSKAITDKLTAATSKLNVLEGKLKKAEEIKKYLRERKQQLKEQFGKMGIAKELKKLDKVSYYYNEYLKEYKGILKDRKRMEQKAMAILYNTPLFKKFAEKNSILASLFRLPNNTTGNITSTLISANVQTRASVQQIMQTSVAAGGPNAMNQVRQQIQVAQAELSKLKDKIAKYGSADAEIPSFKPNTQKTKSFLDRLEYGANIQFGKANNFLPTASDLALSLGYKLNTNGSIGIGASYKLGLGKGWNNIKLTSEGVGMRTYIDWKLKGKFYLSGGYEQNYNSGFKNIEQLRNYSAWQSSGLVGLSKKLQLKGNKNTKLQLLHDLLYRQHIPVTQPFIFRTSFNLK